MAAACCAGLRLLIWRAAARSELEAAYEEERKQQEARQVREQQCAQVLDELLDLRAATVDVEVSLSSHSGLSSLSGAVQRAQARQASTASRGRGAPYLLHCWLLLPAVRAASLVRVQRGVEMMHEA